MKAVWALLCMLACVSAFYMYLVQATVLATAQREEFEYNVQELSARIGVAEARYSELSQEITYAYAEGAGFREPIAQVFAQQTHLVANDRGGLYSR